MDKSYALTTWLDTETRLKLNHKSDLKAILILAGQLFIYLICLVGAIADFSIYGNVVCSIYIGLVIGQTFVIGHDACHQALAGNSFINKTIGRFALSMALHSYTLWNLEHNIKHHGHTNIKGSDPSWTPMTKEEFDQLRKFRQWLERLYRSPFGMGIYYINEMWLKKHILPISRDARLEWRKHLPDAILVMITFAIQIYVILLLGSIIAQQKTPIEIVLLGWVIPFITWNWIMGFIIFLHHTHPNIPWFKNDERPPFNQIQTLITTHIIFPEPLNTLLYNIMEHTAHHLQPSVPMYNLHRSQNRLEEVHGEDIVVYHWTPVEYLRIIRACKLYNYDLKLWTDFDGNPTSEINLNTSYGC